MAVSAFRSTTKRTQVGPSGRGGGRQSQHGFSEPNTKYFSDSSSMSNPRFGDSQRPRASGRRHSSLDSESDADGSSSSRRYQRSSRRGGRDGSESDGGAFRSLRRVSSQTDSSRHRNRKAGMLDEASGDEMQVEERTIRAVHAQMKQLKDKHPSEEFDVLGLYDAMKAEVRQAIADLQQEIRQSGSERRDSTELDDVEIRKGYAEQLEASERRANDLWSELAQEEQRCMDLSKRVKELLPDSRETVSRRAYRSRRYLDRRHMVSQSLDEDARKFFQDCVAVSDCQAEGPSDGDKDISERSSVISTEFTEPEAAKVTPLDQEAVASALPTKPDRKVIAETGSIREKQSPVLVVENPCLPAVEVSRKVSKGTISPSKNEGTKSKTSSSPSSLRRSKSSRNRRPPVNADGVVMPWLEWETGSSESSRLRSRKHNRAPSFEEVPSNGQLNMFFTSGDSGAESSSSIKDEDFRWDSAGSILSSELEELLPQRMRFVDRILSGRMHLCTDVF